MRKLVGYQVIVIAARSILFSVVFLLAAIFCHAQDSNMAAICLANGFNTDEFSIAATSTSGSLTSNSWYLGQTYNVRITIVDGSDTFLQGSWSNNCRASVTIYQWPLYSSGSYATGSVDTNVTLSNLIYVSPTEISFTASVAGGGSSEVIDQLQLNTTGIRAIWPIFISPVSAPLRPYAPSSSSTPTITSIKPSAWFAGKAQNITITGTNFDSFGGSLSITGKSAGSVPVTNVSFVDSTTITATVKPAVTYTADTADVTVTTAPYEYYMTSKAFKIDILPVPIILWNNTDVSGPNATPPSSRPFDVGQRVNLTTKPEPKALPAGINITSSAWTVEGSNIGGYTPTPSSYDTADVLTTVTNLNNLQTYWVYAQDNIPVTYQYCVDPSITGTNNCSLPSSATFNINNPGNGKMKADAYNAVVINDIKITPCFPVVWAFFLQYGQFTGWDQDNCPGWPIAGTPGITFAQPDNSSNGEYSFIQLIISDITTLSNGIKSISCIDEPGFDGGQGYPFPKVDTGSTNDSPDVILGQKYKTASRIFEATMYLMWKSSKAESMPVPIGYQIWHFNASAINSGYPSSEVWSAPISDYVGNEGDFIPSATDTKSPVYPYGYPIWRNLSKCTWK